jgi:translation initiation factor 2 beta subunit (eIF-2beta)/eIF-5
VRFGIFAGDGEVMRVSTVLRRCADKGMPEVAAELRKVWEQYPSCPTHGKLEDPIIGRVGTQVAICCPWCSGSDVLRALEHEGKVAHA